ncbi:MAG: cob(I)yrinic acid a,c-diamide adenosyltransferase [Candidatus Dadabacteria bacterium]|nr:cob(I)yrinic acid a,c-diamide adenosyltransferase [Candidatus Dadabacteria bacterium]NIQ15227.1 cob(I)yrinic acid a,c-diamide adenosyltransferase [Candidatus Dadabacteria bacterium]
MGKNRITKVYTKTGDKGETTLVGGEKISKASPRVDAYGDIDELNSVLGLVYFEIKDSEIKNLIKKIQNDLFIMGGDMATKTDSKYGVPRINSKMYKSLEEHIDKFVNEVGELKEFILPGGSLGGSYLHLARVVCRRAERKVALLMNSEKINEDVLIYLNRLSDFLFVLARVVNKRSGFEEVYADFDPKDN